MSSSDKKTTNAILNALDAQGFTYRKTGSGHYQVRDPEGFVIAIMAATPSDYRSIKNTLSDLRRAGFVWERK